MRTRNELPASGAARVGSLLSIRFAGEKLYVGAVAEVGSVVNALWTLMAATMQERKIPLNAPLDPKK